jgi:acyl-CoA thioester hydrolase
MPLIHTRAFRVRYHECDAYGHVNNVNYLRYMQEAAFDASASAGYDFGRYAAMNRWWLVRQTEVEYRQPARYGDTIEVATWVMDFQRVRSRRRYELRSARSGQMVATGVTDWVFADATTGRPVPVPEEMVAAFFPEGYSGEPPPRQRFPSPPSAPPGLFRARRRVAWSDIDSAQRVNNTTYMTYVEDCGMRVLAAHGWSVPRMSAEGFGMVLRRHLIEHLQAAVLDDELEISTWVTEVRRASATRHYAITRLSDGALVARVNTEAAWVDLATGRPIRIPERFLADFASNTSAAAPGG